MQRIFIDNLCRKLKLIQYLNIVVAFMFFVDVEYNAHLSRAVFNM